MTVFEFQEKYSTLEEKKEALSNMSEEEARKIIDSCGTPQGKAFFKKLFIETHQ